MTEYRAVFDAEVAFTNGGGIKAEGFRVDVPTGRVTEDEVGTLWLASMGLLMAGDPLVSNLRIVSEPHKGTRGGPSDRPVPGGGGRFVDLSHPLRHGQVTYPGLPAPVIGTHLTREASADVYSPGTQFQIDRIEMVGNTGTYVDSPFHRYPDGHDLAGLGLHRLAELPAVVVRTAGSAQRAVDVGHLAAHAVRGRAVLLHTGGDSGWGTAAYAENAPYLTEAGAAWLAEQGAALVGIDAVNIDRIVERGERPAHSVLLAAGIPIVEHLTNLAAVPPTGSTFSAVPPAVVGMGTFTVRAYAHVPDGGANPAG